MTVKRAHPKYIAVQFSPDTVAALHQTASAIAPDAIEFCSCNEEFAELIIDADRISMFATEAANAEVVGKIKTHGYDSVLKAVAKLCNYV